MQFSYLRRNKFKSLTPSQRYRSVANKTLKMRRWILQGCIRDTRKQCLYLMANTMVFT
uniref:Uncharacterized protein n=1 Tax=Arundo donax TaxID=35708 RepID=A0A0A9DYL2_ARUDO